MSGGKLLGVGAFGAVFTHFDKKSQQIQAVKKIKISSTGDSDYEEVKYCNMSFQLLLVDRC